MNAFDSTSASVISAATHPNELDRKRIERAIGNRKRYRYVSPSVDICRDGYVIRSPCCSRNVDPGGGVVDIALVQYWEGPTPWAIYRRDHGTGAWCLHAVHDRLPDLLEQLNLDPLRQFWQ